jgi:signal transduction histidine kinase
MEGRGAITVRSALRKGRVVVEIADDGPGIPPEIQSRIFDAFFTTKPPGRGTGLGLNTSYKIVVQKHGGSIRAESHPGSTRFIVELPLTPPRSEQGADTPFTSDQEE